MQSSGNKHQWICGCKTVNVVDLWCDVVVCSECGHSQLAYLVQFTPVVPTAVTPKAA